MVIIIMIIIIGDSDSSKKNIHSGYKNGIWHTKTSNEK